MGYWSNLAAKKDMGLLNHPWAKMLHDGLQRNDPEMFEELTKDKELDAYIVVKVEDAIREVEVWKGRGIDEKDAIADALDALIPKAEEDLDDVEDWEVEGAAEDEADALGDFFA